MVTFKEVAAGAASTRLGLLPLTVQQCGVPPRHAPPPDTGRTDEKERVRAQSAQDRFDLFVTYKL